MQLFPLIIRLTNKTHKLFDNEKILFIYFNSNNITY